jgi:2-polyprenyl-3-methyl-5-hydroxy-6-metoxy-1,4-benzoquinol methylase
VSDEFTCIACGAHGFRDIAYPGAGAGALNFSSIRLCTECGLGRAQPMPAQAKLDAFYRSGAFWDATGNHPAQRAHESVQAQMRVQHCLRYLSPARALRVLDIGAGHGCVADWLARLPPGRVASYAFVELDTQRRAEILAKSPGFTVQALDAIPEQGQFDLILLNHVLEHVAAPVEIMLSVSRLIAADGVAYVETPHLDYRFKADVFPHTYFFSPMAYTQLGKHLPVRSLESEAFGAWPGRTRGVARQVQRALGLTFAFAVKVRWRALQRGLDRAIWRYRPHPDGIWVRWVVTPERR